MLVPWGLPKEPVTDESPAKFVDAIDFVLRGKSGLGLWVSGERCVGREWNEGDR